MRQGAIEDQIFEAEQGSQAALVAAERAGEMTQVRIAGVVAWTNRAFVAVDPKRVIADGVLELQHHRGVLPRARKAKDLDARMIAVAGLVGNVAPQHGETGGVARRHFGVDAVAVDGFGVEWRGGVSPKNFAAADENE